MQCSYLAVHYTDSVLIPDIIIWRVTQSLPEKAKKRSCFPL